MNELVIRIQAPEVNGHRKFTDAISGLIKAYNDRFGIDLRESHQEQSPYQAIRDLEEQALADVDEGMYRLFAAITKTWLRTSLIKAKETPFKLNGRIFINPKTGKPLTNREWEIIVRDVEKAFGHIFKNAKELLVYKAMALGKIIQSYANPADVPSLSAVSLPARLPTYLDNAVEFAERNAAEHIVSLTAEARKRIATTIINAQKNRIGSRQLEADLFDRFASLNRDWRRVAQTELITNANNAALATAVDQAKSEGVKHTFMIGISAPNACPWCASHVRGQVVVVLDRPPKSGKDDVRVNGQTYKAIWEGKSNIGRDRDEWWVASGTQHPHCRCAWNRFMPEVASAYKMRA